MTVDEALEIADEPVRNGNDQYHACNALAAEVRRLQGVVARVEKLANEDWSGVNDTPWKLQAELREAIKAS